MFFGGVGRGTPKWDKLVTVSKEVCALLLFTMFLYELVVCTWTVFNNKLLAPPATCCHVKGIITDARMLSISVLVANSFARTV